MTAAGMWPENSQACLSLSQSPSYHVQREEEGEQIRATKSCSGGGSSRWQSWLPSYEQPEGSSVVYHKPSAPLSPSVQRQIGHCYYTNSAGYPRGALSQVLR